MKQPIKLIAMVILKVAIILPACSILAQEGHAHEAPHGGTVTTVGKYHYEIVVDHKENTALFYLLDEKENTLPLKDITGKATFLFPNKLKETVDLMVEEDHFKTTLDSTKLDEFTSVVILKIDGKNQIGRFKYKAGTEEGHHEGKKHHKEGEHHEKDENHKEKPKENDKP